MNRAGVRGAIGKTPLIRLKRLEALLELRNELWAKCEHMNPGGSVKDRLALALVTELEESGKLKSGSVIVEATAGNTGVGLALVSAGHGYRVVCVMPEKMSMDKRVMLTSLGCEVVVTPNAPPSSSDNFRMVAERMASERGYVLANQFRSEANPRIHEHTTALEILETLDGRVGAFVAGAGTGGTITGVARALRRECPQARVVLADPVGSCLAAWVRTGELTGDGPYAVEGIGGSIPTSLMDRSLLDGAEIVSDEDSFNWARHLIRKEGLYVGGSAGTNLAAALRTAARPDVEGPVVTILPDAWDRYATRSWFQAQ